MRYPNYRWERVNALVRVVSRLVGQVGGCGCGVVGSVGGVVFWEGAVLMAVVSIDVERMQQLVDEVTNAIEYAKADAQTCYKALSAVNLSDANVLRWREDGEYIWQLVG
jgi:hypothetical protein